MKILGIIPARGGSKGVPQKNIKILNGKPLIWYTHQASKASKLLSRTIVSSEDKNILDVCNSIGMDIPFVRPQNLANDKTPTIDVIFHALKKIEELGEQYDAVCLLQVTTPFRTPQLIDDAIDYSSNQKILGKNTGDDFKEGKITLPIILAYGRSNEIEKKFWNRTISELKQENGDFNQALEIINKYQCIEDTITRAKHFSNVALDSIDIFKDNIFKEKLVSIVSTSISRIY